MKQDHKLTDGQAALGRAMIYDFLAQALAYPDEDRIADLRDMASIVLHAGGWVPLLRLAAMAREVPADILQIEFITAQTLNTSPDCPLFETAYFGADPQQQTQRMADISGFYKAFGVEIGSGEMRPDDLTVELEFMAFLCRKEAYASDHLGAPRMAQARKAQRMFFENHLGRWAGVAGAKLNELSGEGRFYGAAGAALASWIDAEVESLRVAPQLVAGAVPVFPMPATHGPEFAGNASFIPSEELAVR